MRSLIAIAVLILVAMLAYKKGFFAKAKDAMNQAADKTNERSSEVQMAEREIKTAQEPDMVIAEALAYLEQNIKSTQWWASVETEAANIGVRPWQIIWSRAIGTAETRINHTW